VIKNQIKQGTATNAPGGA
jgi:hypothetical protein